MKVITLTWLFRLFEKQGFGVLVTLGFAIWFAFKTDRLEQRLDACQTAREDIRIQQVVSSSESVVRAIETLIGKMEARPTTTVLKRATK